MRTLFAIAVLASTPFPALQVHLHAQMTSGPAPTIAPGTVVDPSKSFDAMLTAFEQEFTAAARAMPADKYGFAPGAGNMPASQKGDFKGVRTFVQQVTHVAEADYHYGAALGGLKADVDTRSLASITGKDQALAALAASFVFAHKAIATLTAKNAFESIHESETRASLAGALVAHGFDHYGQMVEYLRMNGITPPASAR